MSVVWIWFGNFWGSVVIIWFCDIGNLVLLLECIMSSNSFVVYMDLLLDNDCCFVCYDFFIMLC